MASRYRHIVRAFQDEPVADTLVQERLEALARWGGVRATVASLLYLGLFASILGLLAQFVPGLSDATNALQAATSLLGAFTGLFTIAFLFLTRLLGQIEADIWCLLAKRRKSLH